MHLKKIISDTDVYPKVYLYRRVVQSKLFIDAHFSESIDLDNIAGEANFSRFHFIRLFKKIYRFTPHQYLAHVRIEQAKELLKNEITAREACYAVGFSSVSTFTGLFKRCTGETPSAYQRHHRKLVAAIKEAPLEFIPYCFAEAKGWTKKSNFEEA